MSQLCNTLSLPVGDDVAMSTDYRNVFIEAAPDCPATEGEEPPAGRGNPTVARLQYELLSQAPYEMSSDDVLFAVHAARTGVPPSELDEARAAFFAKDQPCLRASPLGKRYGWGTHHDGEGRVALYGVGTVEYERLARDPNLGHKAAMKSRR
ncbi:hypothetical protein CH289_05410 [Rhodococcus sp. RS1C4]|nr:hypothetical protein CH289_05410 [Rhodococcus sp. RS1C4]OZE84886.1 hypothetical protein CH304_06895 [Rhodococcus sp. 15-649-1-2]